MHKFANRAHAHTRTLTNRGRGGGYSNRAHEDMIPLRDWEFFKGEKWERLIFRRGSPAASLAKFHISQRPIVIMVRYNIIYNDSVLVESRKGGSSSTSVRRLRRSREASDSRLRECRKYYWIERGRERELIYVLNSETFELPEEPALLIERGILDSRPAVSNTSLFPVACDW